MAGNPEPVQPRTYWLVGDTIGSGNSQDDDDDDESYDDNEDDRQNDDVVSRSLVLDKTARSTRTTLASIYIFATTAKTV